MEEYIIEYNSSNVYTEPVMEGIFEFNVSPCHDLTQITVDTSIRSSLSESVFNYKNMFGFEINRVKANNNFNEFKFNYTALVQKKTTKLPSQSALSLKEELDKLYAAAFYIDHHLFLRKSPLACLEAENSKQILPYDQKISLFEYLTKLNAYVHKLLTYQKNVTSVTTKADDALKLKKGVCQDYAHIFIAMARANKIPTRYVSGYLNQGKKFLGASFMHAWVESYIPELGWIGFDPTNNLMADENFIKVSHGADYADCTPIKGVLRSNGGENKSSYQVKVAAQ
ncbi:MAG TPA: transglutaminase family protein [Cytophagaceae bacterium]|jgi:transglutaminase-like putative cysteine protease|nr:transglutaminase family protein [Cytophagaceae bacterium]